MGKQVRDFFEGLLMAVAGLAVLAGIIYLVIRKYTTPEPPK